jgi:AcrR family transcriptional regulator
MSPRPYQLGKRQAQVDDARRRILDAARALLAESASYTGFTVDAVAKKADVARATVYYQFGTKTGLLEALCDDLAEAGRMSQLAGAFTAAEPRAALAVFVETFAAFWDADRLVMRRLRALAPLDPDVGAVIAARDGMRRQGVEVLVGRFAPTAARKSDEVARILFTLTSFETFDALAGERLRPPDVVGTVVDLAYWAVAGGGHA